MQPIGQQQAMQQQQMQQLMQHLQAVTHNAEYLFQRSMKMHKRLCALEAERMVRARGGQVATPIEFRSQFGEDAAIWDLLSPEVLAGKPQGLIIEVGAFDGETFSASAGLEQAGWKCLLIEAIPQRFEQCVRNRPKATVVHAALGRPGAGERAEFTVVEDHWGGMLSYLNTDELHRATIASNKQKSTQVSVPQTTMNALLERQPAGTEVDAAIIDVEGGEVPLLEGFDLQRWKPKVLVLEDNAKREGTAVDIYMRAQPYALVGFIAVNRVYVRADLQHCKARLA